MSGRSGCALLILGVAALLLAMPAPVRAWRMEQFSLKSSVLPIHIRLSSMDTSADLDGDKLPERLALSAGRAVIWKEDRMLWQSPLAWHVQQAQVTDLNRDGIPEITLLVWRAFKPWPVDAWLPHGGRIEDFHDTDEMSCHIILIGWKQDGYRELWAGSALANPVKGFRAADLQGDGRQYLVTLEGEYADPRSAPARRLKVWEWNGFGFTVVNELDESFPFIDIAQMENGQEVILTP